MAHLPFQELNGEGRVSDLLEELAALLPCDACGCRPCECEDDEDDFFWNEEERHEL